VVENLDTCLYRISLESISLRIDLHLPKLCYKKQVNKYMMLLLQAIVVDEVQKLDSEMHAEICGSFRRGI